MVIKDLLKKAIEEINRVEIGQEFIVKDLFIGHEWNRIKLSTRMNLGRYFLEEYPKDNLEKVKKNSSNQQKYKKLK